MRPDSFIFALAFLVSATAASRLMGQGSLTPPGAPAPTMKRLDQVEPRTLIPGGSAPFVISASGSYYLAGNIAVAGGGAITVNASNVTLDLNGFTISSSANPATGTAVTISAGFTNVTVRNGHIFGSGTISSTGAFSGAGFLDGIAAGADDLGSGVRVHDLTVTGCGGDGINLGSVITAPLVSSAVVERCAVRHVGRYGIQAATVRSSSVTECGNYGIRASAAVSDCVALVRGIKEAISCREAIGCTGIALGSNSYGMKVSVASNCYGYSATSVGIYASETATGCYGDGQLGLLAGVAMNCTGRGTTNRGLRAEQSATNCYGTSTSGIGLSTASATNCYGSSDSDIGLRASNATNCQGVSNSGIGLYADFTATSCQGQTTSGPYGLQVPGIANTCTGGHSNGGVALKATIGNSCATFGGSADITYKYNSP